MSSRAVQLTISILLVVSVLCCSFSVFAVNEVEPSPTPTVPPELDPNNRVVLNAQMASLYVWKMLDSWGIKVDIQDWTNGTDEVLAWVGQMLIDYCLDAGTTLAEMIFPWLINEDFWGNLIVNDRCVRDVEDFAEWLIAKFSLTDNQDKVINPVYTVNGYNLYEVNTWYFSEWRTTEPTNSEYVMWKISVDNYSGDLFFMGVQYSDAWGIILMTDNGSIVYSSQVECRYSANQQTSTLLQAYGMGNPLVGAYGVKYWYFTGNQNQTFPLPTGGTYFQTNESASIQYGNRNSATRQFMDVAKIESVGDLHIVTSNIVTPNIDPAYTDGDSLVIVSGEPNYEVVDWSGQIAVSNLPAVVSTRSLDNPHMEEAYQPVQGLIEMTKDGVELVHGIVNELPGEAVTCIYALIGAVIVFGMIKLMREH